MLHAPVDEVNALDTKIEAVVKRYENAIVAVEQAGETLSAEQVLELLAARSVVDKVLKKLPKPSLKDLFNRNPPSRRSHWVARVKQLNARSNKCSGYTHSSIEGWRVFPNPSGSGWVLHSQNLSKRALPWHDRLDWLWQFLALLCFGVSFVFLADIIKRSFTGGIDIGSASTSLVATLISLVSGGGILTKFGQEKTEEFFTNANIPENLWDEFRCLISVAFLTLLIAFWWLLPNLSYTYIHLAKDAHNAAKQEDYYLRAIALKPSSVEAHLGLAEFYVKEQDFDAALPKFKTAFYNVSGESKFIVASKAAEGITKIYLNSKEYSKADHWLSQALSQTQPISTKSTWMQRQHANRPLTLSEPQFELIKRLGRIYLVEERRPIEAIRWFKIGLDRTGTIDLTRKYDLLTHLAWSQFKAGLVEDAKASFASAFLIETLRNKQQASAHCRLAEALEEQNKNEPETKIQATSEWKICLANLDKADLETSDGIAWQRSALQYIKSEIKQE